MQKKEAYLTVTLSWLALSIFGCIPYLISGAIPSFINAFFESVSGFTTTGSSILTDIESLPKSILFWRSLTHWIGGIGIIVLVIIVMPSLQIGGYHLFSMESSFQEKIKPRISTMGQQLLYIYLLLTFILIVLLLLGGMNAFESICHAFGTIATGGFSPKNDSIAGYSAYIQYVVMTFMLLSGSNFVIHYYLIRREFKKIGTNEEFKFFLSVILIVSICLTGILFFKMHKPLRFLYVKHYFR
jgi:trk system potassium uptake protein